MVLQFDIASFCGCALVGLTPLVGCYTSEDEENKMDYPWYGMISVFLQTQPLGTNSDTRKESVARD